MTSVARAGVAFVLAVVALVATPTIAQAVVFIKTGEISVSDPSTLGPVGLAVAPSSGDLYATMPFAPTAGGDSVQRFDASGASQGTFAPGIAAFGVAVDRTATPENGDVYVYDAGLFDMTPDINVFSATGTPVGSPFSVEANLDPGTGTFDPQQIGSDAQGNVYYPNAVDDVVEVYSPSGALLGSLNGTDATALIDPRVVAVDDSFNIYIVDSADGGRVLKTNLFDQTFSVVAGTTGAVAVAVDPASGDFFVGQGSGSAFHVVGYDSSGTEIADFGAGDFPDGNPFPRRIAVDGSSAKTKVYVSNSGGGASVLVYEEGAPPPTVTTMSASGVEQTTAVLAGTVSQSTVAEIESCRFEYTDDADFVANGFANADGAPCTAEYPDGASSLVLATANVSGLEPNTTYRFRLVAGNQDASGQGSDVVFRTLPNPPAVVTGTAADVQHTRARLGGTVNPNGGPVTTCEIDFGTTTAYGQSRPCASSPGDGTSAVGVSAEVAGLSAGTTYHFRVRAANGGGATEGQNQTFRTPDRPDPCAVDPNSCKPTDQCVVTPAVCKPAPAAAKASVPGRISVRGGRALIRVSCKGPAGATCKATLRLRARIDPPGRRKARTLTIGRARYELAAGRSELVRVRLSRAARRSLARKGRLRGRVTGPVVSDRSVLLRLRPSD